MVRFECEGCGWTVNAYGRLVPPASLFCADCVWLEGVYERHGLEVATAIAMQFHERRENRIVRGAGPRLDP